MFNSYLIFLSNKKVENYLNFLGNLDLIRKLIFHPTFYLLVFNIHCFRRFLLNVLKPYLFKCKFIFSFLLKKKFIGCNIIKFWFL